MRARAYSRGTKRVARRKYSKKIPVYGAYIEMRLYTISRHIKSKLHEKNALRSLHYRKIVRIFLGSYRILNMILQTDIIGPRLTPPPYNTPNIYFYFSVNAYNGCYRRLSQLPFGAGDLRTRLLTLTLTLTCGSPARPRVRLRSPPVVRRAATPA